MSIELCAAAMFTDAADEARAEAMVRALVPEGVEVIEEHAESPDNDVAGDKGFFAIKWKQRP